MGRDAAGGPNHRNHSRKHHCTWRVPKAPMHLEARMSQPLEVIVAWGPTIIDVLHLQVGERFTLGEGSPYGGVEDLVPPGQSITLASVDADGPRIYLPEGVSGVYQAGDVLTPLSAEQNRSLVLGREGRVRAEAGALTLYFQRVEAAERPARSGLLSLLGDVRGIAGAAVLHAVFLLVALALPPESQALSMDNFDEQPRWVETSLVPQQEKDLFKGLDPVAKPEDPRGAEPTGPAEPTDPALPPSGSQWEPKGPKVAGGGLTPKARQDVAIAAATELSNVLGDGDLFGGASPLGQRAISALDGLNGGDPGTGLAMNGPRGGGGLFEGPLGGAGLPGGPTGGPRGPAGLAPGGYRTRTGRPGPRTDYPGERGEGTPKFKVTPQTPLVEDGLSREEIQRVVRLKQGEYRYCYEKQLQGRPDLEGKVTLKFVVGPTGRVLVTEVLEDTLADGEVASCIANKARLWQFPVPRGGGVVAVKYPFLFRRS